MVAIPSKFIQFGGFIWNYLLMLPFQLVCFMYVSFLGFNPSWNSIHNIRWSHLLLREEFCLEFLKNSSVVCFSDTIRCSTCPLVLGCWDLSHVIFLKPRKKELLAKLRKFTKWQPRTILSENSCHFVNLLSFASSSFFLSMRKITWLNSQQPKTRGHIEHLDSLIFFRSNQLYIHFLNKVKICFHF